MNPTLLLPSIGVGVLATMLAVASGVAAAVVAMSTRRWRRWILVSGILSLALPPFLAANAWLEVTATWRAVEAPEWVAFATLPLVALVLATGLWPITLFLVLGGWSRVQTEHLESGVAGRGFLLFRRLLLPAASGELRVAVAVTFALALANFTVPTLFQVRVFTEEFWVRFNTQFDLAGALLAAWPLLLLPPAVLLWVGRQRISWPRLVPALDPAVFRQHLGPVTSAASAWMALWWCVALVFPLTQLSVAGRTWTELSGAIAAGGSAMRQSLFTAGVSATAVVALALALAGWNRGGGGTSRGLRRVLKWALIPAWVLFLLPGVFEGVLLIRVLNQGWARPVYQSVGILLLALVIRYLAPAWMVIGEGWRTLDRDQADAARSSGAGEWRVFRDVQWPQLRHSAGFAWYAVYLLCLWDVETIVLIQPPGGETLALRVFNLLHYGHGTQVNALCVVLLIMALAPGIGYGLIRALRTRLGRVHPTRTRAAGLGILLFGTLLVGGCSGSGESEATTAVGASREFPIQSKVFTGVRVIGGRGVAPGQFNKPRSLVCDREDNLYVADITGRIQKFDSEGRWLLQWQMPQTDLGKPKGMSLDPDGNIIVVEPHYQRVNHFTTTGRLVRQWGVKGTAPGEMILPRSIAVGADGRYFVSEYTVVDRVQRFSPAGVFEMTCGAPGVEPGHFNRAEGVCINGAGQVFVADSCNHRIQVFSREGVFVRAHGTAGSDPGGLSYPYDIRVDASGRQFVCEFGNSRISIFGSDDRLIEVIGSAGSDPGRFANPWAIAFDSHGNLYVADSQNHRVQKLIARGGGTGQRLAATAENGEGPRS